MADKSMEAWKSWKQAQLKFDYYMVALGSTLFAYLGANFKISGEVNCSYFFELFSFFLIILSVIFGIIRIQTDLIIQSIDFQKAYNQENLAFLNAINLPEQNQHTSSGVITRKHVSDSIVKLKKIIDRAENELDGHTAKSKIFFNIRNMALLFGFFSLLVSRVIVVYVV